MRQQRNIGAWAALALLSGGGAVALYLLLVMRFHVSESLPAGSTLLTGPQGDSVFYEALSRTPGLTVRRQHDRHAPSTDAVRATWFATGVTDLRPFFGPDTDMRAVVARGGRQVVAFAPIAATWTNTPGTGLVSRICRAPAPVVGTNTVARRALRHRERGNTRDSGEEEEDGCCGVSPEPSCKEIGVAWCVANAVTTLTARCASRTPAAPVSLPVSIPMRTSLVFTNISSAWTVLYRTPEGPAVIERRWGAGTIVCVADSHLFSNESLWRACPAEWLAWTVGSSRLVVFDETHHGLERATTMMTLARDLGLSGFFLALAVVALLLLWQQSLPLVAPPALAPDAPLAGQGAHAGLVRLLHRSLDARQALTEGINRWEQTAGRSLGAVRMARVRNTFAHAAATARPTDVFHALREASRPGAVAEPPGPPAAD